MSVIDPDIERRDVTPPDIDSEDFEVGPYVGLLAIQDFDADWVYGIRAAWHVSEDFFFEANYGQSQGDLTSFEKLSGGAPLFDDSERDYTFYDINIAWNALPGEIFLFGQRALKSDLYLVLGAGNTDFLGDNWFTVNIGAGYRLLLNDWLALRLDVRDHIFDRDTFGESEITHNVELATTLTYFF
ncbi:MAG: outer membrane beta-barrel domain-containing protein [Pseudomonadota bacterium]